MTNEPITEQHIERATEMIQKLYGALAPWAQAARDLEAPDHPEPFDDPEEVLWAGRTGFLRVRDFRRALEVVRWVDAEIEAAAEEDGR